MDVIRVSIVIKLVLLNINFIVFTRNILTLKNKEDVIFTITYGNLKGD